MTLGTTITERASRLLAAADRFDVAAGHLGSAITELDATAPFLTVGPSGFFRAQHLISQAPQEYAVALGRAHTWMEQAATQAREADDLLRAGDEVLTWNRGFATEALELTSERRDWVLTRSHVTIDARMTEDVDAAQQAFDHAIDFAHDRPGKVTIRAKAAIYDNRLDLADDAGGLVTSMSRRLRETSAGANRPRAISSIPHAQSTAETLLFERAVPRRAQFEQAAEQLRNHAKKLFVNEARSSLQAPMDAILAHEAELQRVTADVISEARASARAEFAAQVRERVDGHAAAVRTLTS